MASSIKNFFSNKRRIKHFTHPDHHLLRSTTNGTFQCDMCIQPGAGRRYRCDDCDFDIHEKCTSYPQTLNFYTHPWHELSLIPGPEAWCDVCGDKVAGFFYRCLPCGFDMHPHCSLLPQRARTRLHPEHSLMLLPGPGRCTACKEVSLLWSYRCGPCGVGLHTQCLHGAAAERARGGGAGSSGGRRGDHEDDGEMETLLHALAQTAALESLSRDLSELLHD